MVNDTIKNSEIEVSKRSIYAYGRKSTVYDARGTLRGVAYNVTTKSKKETIAQAKAEIAYLLSAGEFVAGGCVVRANGFQSWEFVLPGRCVMSFGAVNLAEAISTAAGAYNDHPEAAEFCRTVGAR